MSSMCLYIQMNINCIKQGKCVINDTKIVKVKPEDFKTYRKQKKA